MAVWNLAESLDTALKYATYAQYQVITRVKKASVCHHTLHVKHCQILSPFMGVSTNQCVKSDITTLNNVHISIVNMFYCSTIKFVIDEFEIIWRSKLLIQL